MHDLEVFLDELQDTPGAPLLRLLVQEVAGLDPRVRAQVGAYGVVFKLEERLLCEISILGEMLIARVGPEQSVEYRVRNRDLALTALDHILQEFDRATSLQSSSSPTEI